MTTATLHLIAPTRIELGLLRIVRQFTALVECRIARRAERRMLALDLLRHRQANRHRPIAVDHILAQAGLPRR